MTDTATDLLRAIALFPDEDTPRLAYADYLQENGDEDRAEFIRCQCFVARMNNVDPKTEPISIGDWDKFNRCRTQVKELLRAHESEWRRPACPKCNGDPLRCTRCRERMSPLKKDRLPLLSACLKCGQEGGFWEDKCPTCHGTGSCGPLSERVETNYDDASDTHRSTKWKHAVTWVRGFPVVKCKLEEVIEQQEHCRSCGWNNVHSRTSGRKSVCPQCNETWHDETVHALTGWAVACVRTGATFEVTDKTPGTHSGGTGDRAGHWWEPGINFDAARQVPFGIGEEGVKLGLWRAGFHGGIMVYVPPKGTPRDKGWATAVDALDALNAVVHRLVVRTAYPEVKL